MKESFFFCPLKFFSVNAKLQNSNACLEMCLTGVCM